MTYLSKTTSLGLVEVRYTSVGYAIFLNNQMREYSSDLNFITNLFHNKY